MTIHHFGTDVNPSHYLETPDPANAGQVKRPDAGLTVLVKNSATLASLPPIISLALGYWNYTTTDVPGILVSGDSGQSWVGPLWSQEAQTASMTSGVDASAALVAASSAKSTADALGARVNTVELNVAQLQQSGVSTTVDWVTQVANKPTIPTTAAQVGAIPTSALGAANGVAALDAAGKVPIAQIPVGTASGTVAAGNAKPSVDYSQLPPFVTLTLTDNGAGTFPSRPTTRTDLITRWRGSAFPASGGAASVANVDEYVQRVTS